MLNNNSSSNSLPREIILTLINNQCHRIYFSHFFQQAWWPQSPLHSPTPSKFLWTPVVSSLLRVLRAQFLLEAKVFRDTCLNSIRVSLTTISNTWTIWVSTRNWSTTSNKLITKKLLLKLEAHNSNYSSSSSSREIMLILGSSRYLRLINNQYLISNNKISLVHLPPWLFLKHPS